MTESGLYRALEEVFSQQGRPGYMDAVAAYVKILGIDPGHGFSHVHYGMLMDMLNRPADADNQYREVGIITVLQ